jgi:tetratricopeptide (TPR) repeat protein
MRTSVEAHGGTVAKFIGDAVMAVFGIPTVHEDDALRAVRAAADMRATLAGLNEELERSYGVVLLTRTGVNTGELLIKDPTPAEGLVVGDPVNTAARLEQAAAPGEILMSASTYRMVRDAVVAEPIDAIAAKGEAEPVAVYRLLEVIAGPHGAARHFDSSLVGRERERALLESTYQRAVSDPSCQLVTLMGSPGIGKSRLVAELLETVHPEARVLTGRCLPYGEGITFWPIGEIVRQAAGISDEDSLEAARAKLRTVVEDDPHAEGVAALVGELVGLAPAESGPEETFWALRRFLEVWASGTPLVVFLDDIQWAEPTLLDLIDHLAEWHQGVPLLLLCTSRPELLEVRPEWGSRSNAVSIPIEPLAGGEANELLAGFAGHAAMPPSVSAHIVEAAGGNPLFLEEMFALLVADGLLERTNGAWVLTTDLDSIPVPPTIAALLATRLDHLEAEERAVLAIGSVVGEVFWRTSVAELARQTPGPEVDTRLQGLVGRELIRPERSAFLGDDAFRFRHLLVRDAAYAALPKADRAELHEVFTLWLERVAGERVGEFEAILGYHLEQACRLRTELSLLSEADGERKQRAARWLARAGRRARDQGDDRAASGLLERAANLLPDDDLVRVDLLVERGRVLWNAGELARAEEVLSEAVDASAGAEDRCLHGRALMERMFCRIFTGPWLGSAQEVVAEWLPVFTEGSDDRGLALAHRLQAWIDSNQGRIEEAQRSHELAWYHARRAGDTRQALDCLGALRVMVNLGPTPAPEALRLIRRYSEEVTGRLQRARLEWAEAWALAMLGDIDQSRELLAGSRATYLELGLALESAGAAQTLYLVETMAGDAGAATDELWAVAENLEAVGETNILATIAGMLADALVGHGRHDEAERYLGVCERLADPSDVDAQTRWRRARARLLARRHETRAAEHLAREALALIAATDFLNDHGSTLLDLAEVLRAAGRPGEANAAVRQALDLFERKENVAMATQARRLL